MTSGSVEKCNVQSNIDMLKYFRDKMGIATTSLVPSNYTSLVEIVPIKDPESSSQLYNK